MSHLFRYPKKAKGSTEVDPWTCVLILAEGHGVLTAFPRVLGICHLGAVSTEGRRRGFLLRIPQLPPFRRRTADRLSAVRPRERSFRPGNRRSPVPPGRRWRSASLGRRTRRYEQVPRIRSARLGLDRSFSPARSGWPSAGSGI